MLSPFSIYFALFFGLTFLTAIDIFNLFEWRFIKPLPYIAAFAFIAARIGGLWKGRPVLRPSISILSFILLFLFALPGLVLNKLHGEHSSFFTGIFQILIVTAALWACEENRRLGLTTEKVLRCLQLLGFAFCGIGILGHLMKLGLPGVSGWFTLVTHEKGYLLPLAFLPSLALGDKKRARIGLALAIVFTILSLKLILALLIPVTYLLFWLLGKLKGERPIWVMVGVMLFVALFPRVIFDLPDQISNFVYFHIQRPLRLKYDDIPFFHYILHKGNDFSLRRMTWTLGFAEFAKSPIYGNLFQGWASVLIPFERTTWEVPYHNDFLEVAAKGGAIGLSLMLTGFFASLFETLRFRSRLRFDSLDRRFHDVLFVTIVASMLCLFINPVLNQTRSGVGVWFILGLAFLMRVRSGRHRVV